MCICANTASSRQHPSFPISVAAEIRRVSGTGNGDSSAVELSIHLNGRALRFSTQVGVPAGKTAVLGNVGEDPRGTLILTVRPELITASP